MENKSCPCLYLDNPCYGGNCTCVTPISSAGCQNCCTHGSLKQKKIKAELINKAVNNFRKDTLEELSNLGQIYDL